MKLQVRVAALLGACLFIALLSASAQGDEVVDAPSLALTNLVVKAPRQDYLIAGLVTHRPGVAKFKYGIALFPGHPGIIRLREDEGEIRFDLGGNFLVRSRRHWLDEETLVLTVDAPSDQWSSFSQRFREEPRYGEDVEALLVEVGRRYAIEDWTLVGTSEGSISAFHAGRMNQSLARRVILTASVFVAGRNGPGLSGVEFDAPAIRLLWVHHESDPCRFTPYHGAKQFAAKSRSPLLTVRGGGPERGAPCEARSFHGFVGVEAETVMAMRSWVKTGVVPADISKP
jgi:hypothetical protein